MEVCIYDRIVYIVKKGINIFSKKGVLRGGTIMLRGAQKKILRTDSPKKCPPP